MNAPRVAVRAEGVRVEPVDDDVSVVLEDPGYAEARRRFGGIDWAATVAGATTALGTAAVLAGLLAGAGTVGYQLDRRDTDDLTAAGLVAGLALLVLAFLFGGWVAGRIARYDGGRNGAATVVWFVVLSAATAALGAWAGREHDLFGNLHLPQWFSSDARSTAAVLSGVLTLALCAAAGWLGGRGGERWHRRADALIAHTRPSAMVRLEEPGA